MKNTTLKDQRVAKLSIKSAYCITRFFCLKDGFAVLSVISSFSNHLAGEEGTGYLFGVM